MGDPGVGTDPDRQFDEGSPTAEDEFERRLAALVEWGIEHGVAFDRAWTLPTGDGIDYDVMVECVYVDRDGSGRSGAGAERESTDSGSLRGH